ncbi:AbiH family protein [Zunongwangia endophytica]|uniref:AbiH family protein n=1 Tax=Zunongwangia endophytica TaxID=1808945 RepID=A0ABV8H4Z2_9FLAO|nr:AbiH family protein [Zunongwangia endophytica]MDN3595306.1 AbiH family protein [Zunongwangia endophytica]
MFEHKNILILIGNGFDIANGMETKFSDFANNYLDKIIIPELIRVRKGDCDKSLILSDPFFKNWNAKGTYNLPNKSYLSLWNSYDNHDMIRNEILNDYKKLNLILRNKFLAKLYSTESKNWFDIENLYFKNLIGLKKSVSVPGSSIKPLQNLNVNFNEVKTAVIDYLANIEVELDRSIAGFIQHHLEDLENLYFLNFNYTSTVLNYKHHIRTLQGCVINHIHGDFSRREDIVFGYGNDQNSEYQEIKSLEIDEFLRYFKTFDYLNNSHYDHLHNEFLNKYENFEVVVLGHSLGQTDKTLLSEIFNSASCKKIHFFKRSDLAHEPSLVRQNFRELGYAASRIINSEADLRNKVVNFEDSKYFP